MRILAGGICHETTTCMATRTTLRDFESGFGLYRDEEIRKVFRGANKCLGGFINGAEHHGFDLVPLLWTFPYPGGLIKRDAYELLKTEFLDRARKAMAEGPVDGALLDQHGSMMIDGIDDGEGDFIGAVRELPGPDRPIIVTTPERPLDQAFARTLGIDCKKFRSIALKSAAHFRSGFESIAGQIFNVDAAAILTHDVTKLPWKRRRRPMFPIEIPPRGRG